MKLNINQHNAIKLIKGASLFTTGGGIPFSDQTTTIENIPNLKTSILSLDQFTPNNYLCTAAELGPTDVPPLNKIKVIHSMFNLLSKTSTKKITGLYPAEIGQESVILESSHLLNLPIADFDPVGFRAVPYIDINIFNLKKIPFSYTPMAIATDRQEVLFINNKLSHQRLENILRELTKLSASGVIYLLGGLISIKTLIKHHLENSAYSQAYQLGQISNLKQLKNKFNPLMTIKATVLNKKQFPQQGFLGEIITVQTQNNEKLYLLVLNEILFILNNQLQIIAQVPQRILLIDPQEPTGLSCALLKKNSQVIIFVIPPDKAWQTKKAGQLFGKPRFKKTLQQLKHLIKHSS